MGHLYPSVEWNPFAMADNKYLLHGEFSISFVDREVYHCRFAMPMNVARQPPLLLSISIQCPESEVHR